MLGSNRTLLVDLEVRTLHRGRINRKFDQTRARQLHFKLVCRRQCHLANLADNMRFNVAISCHGRRNQINICPCITYSRRSTALASRDYATQLRRDFTRSGSCDVKVQLVVSPQKISIGNIGRRCQQATDVDLRPTAEDNPGRIDQKHIAIGRQHAADIGNRTT